MADTPKAAPWSKAMSRNASACTVSTSCPDAWAIFEALTAAGERIYDVVADQDGQAALLPVDADRAGDAGALLRIDDLPQDASVVIRVFRFFEDYSDQACKWEKELRNVNSGSLLWLLVHLLPKMHSVCGAKYGSWFTTHYIRVRTSHFHSAYHMCEEGGCGLAQTFGATSSIRRLVTGAELASGYFWFCTPDRAGCGAPREDVSDAEHLQLHGWQHLGREEPADGLSLVAAWEEEGAHVDERALRQALRSAF